MVKIEPDGTITMTQGDTLDTKVNILVRVDEETTIPYVPSEGDQIRFAVKSSYKDLEPIITKAIPVSTLQLRLESEETKLLETRRKPYVYDIQLTTPFGTVDTFMDRKLMYITEEVD